MIRHIPAVRHAAALTVLLYVTTPLSAGWLPTTGTNAIATTSNWSGSNINGVFDQISTGEQFVTLAGTTNIASLQFTYDGLFGMTLQSNSGTLRTLNLTNGITMDTVQDGRLVQIGANGASVRIGLNNTIQDFTVAGTDELVIYNSITNAGDGGIHKKGTGTLRMEGGAGGYTMGTIVADGTLAIGSNLTLGTGSLTMNGGRVAASGAARTLTNNLIAGGDFVIGGLGSAIILNGTTDLGTTLRNIGIGNTTTFGGAISGSGGVRYYGSTASARTVNYQAANNYTGKTEIDNLITLSLSGAGNLPDTGAVNLLSSTAELSISGITAADETIGSLAGVSGASVSLGAKSLTSGGDGTSTLYAGTISGTGGSVIKTGAGTLTLSASNSYTGATVIKQGTLRVLNSGALGNAPTAATPNHLVIEAGATFSAGLTMTLNSNRGMTIGSTSGPGTSSIDVDTGTTFSYGGIIADNTGGSARLLKTGAGTLYLTGTSNDNSFTGGVTISSGTLRIASGTALGTAPASPTPGFLLIESGATLQISSVFSFSVNRSIAIGPSSGTGAATILVDEADQLTFSGAIANNGSGSGQLIKTGPGVLRLTGASTYNGGTTVLEGTLSFLQGTSMGSSPSTATPGYITISGGIIEFDNGTGNLTLAANRGIALGPTSGSGTGAINVANAAATLTYAGIIADTAGGTGALIKGGAGTLRLQSANTYSGGTTVSAGILMVSNSTGSATGTGSVTVGAGGVLRGNGSISGHLTVQSGGELRPGETAVGTINTAVVNVDASGKLIFRLAANNNNDRLNTGAALLTMDTAALIEVIYEGAYTAAEGHSFNLIDWGTLSSDGNLADQISLPSLALGLTWDTSLLTSQGVISVTAVPEPSRVLMVTAGLVSLLVRRRRGVRA